MTVIGTLGTLLATIPGMTLGTNVISIENPRLTAVEALPSLQIHRVSAMGEFTLEGKRIWTQGRFQITLSAATAAGLEVLTGQVNALLDNNHTDFKISIPLGYYRDGHDEDPEAFWRQGDWYIMY
jgi:hypothetical protein